MVDCITVRLFGPISVQVDGQEVRPGPKQRALLAILALEAEHAVPASRLVELLWREDPPRCALGTLRSHVAHLRRVLEPRLGPRAAHSVLVTEGAGYALRLSPEQVDVIQFGRLVDGGLRALASGDPGAAIEQLGAALALWRGPPLGALAEEPFAIGEATRCGELHRTARRALIEAELRLGHHTEMIAELSALVAEAPTDEELRRQLAVALYRCGRREEAIEMCREGLRRLHEHGLDSPMLQATQRGILQDAPAMRPGGTAADVPAPSVRPFQVPPDVAEFTGRERELAVLRALLSGTPGRCTTAVVISAINGRPGIGKSALAIHLAHELAPRFTDGVLYTNLGSVGPHRLKPLQVLNEFLRSLGIRGERLPNELDAAVAQYRSVLATRQVLVVLDNAADTAQIQPLLPSSARCAALITSRTQLADLNGARPLTLDLLGLGEAVTLLAWFAGPDRVTEDPEAAEAIARQCGLLPLALRIVGARLRARPDWPLRAMSARLADAHRRLDELQVGDLAVRSSFLESYRALPVPDARLFRLLALLDGPNISADVAAALAGESLAGVEARLERLASAQLIQTSALGRYRFHDLMRLFARERVAVDEDPPARTAALERAMRWYLGRARAADVLLKPASQQDRHGNGGVAFADRSAALAWLEAELANLVAAAQQAADQAPAQLAEVAWQLLGALRRFLDLRRRWMEWQAIAQAALHAAQGTADQAAAALALKELGVVHGQHKRFHEATDHFEQALRIARQLGDRDTEERIQNNLGLAYAGQDRYQDAIRCFRRSLSILRQVGDRHGEGESLNNLAEMYANQHRYAQAISCYRRSLAIFEQLGDQEVKVLNNLGLVHLKQHRQREAIEYFERALPICRRLGDRWEEAAALWRLGMAIAATRGPYAARPLWTQALAIFEQLGAAEATEVRSLLANAGGS
jgi:DNA-binding SARP family transcriptional activator/Tfp pilus assembly protein PilF